MLNIVEKAVKKVFGSKSERDMKQMLPLVQEINIEWEKLNASHVSDEDLRAKTQEVKKIIDDRLADIDVEIKNLQKQAEESPDVHEKERLFDEVDKLEEKRNKDLEDVLLEVLPTAFAIIKETAFRFANNDSLSVQATFFDKELATKKSNVEIRGEQAVWYNKWIAADNEITWNMVHYDVQLIGGITLHQGKIAEMATGEGKTLVATLPAFLNALAKRGVHIVTVNDYLAKRDSEWMAPIFEFHGLSVDCIDKHRPHSEERRKAYNADITYGTNNEYGFDYLRDNMAGEIEELVQRKHHFAMIDEVDSVLIDEARTPLIISGPVPRGDQHEYEALKPRIQRLVEVQKKLVQGYLQEAKRLVKEGNDKEAGLPLFRAHRGLPKSKPLIKFLSEPGMGVLLQKTENYYLADNAKHMPEADEPLYFTIDEKNNQIDLTDNGINFISTKDDPQFFIMPNIAIELNKIDEDASLNDEEKLKQKEELSNEYTAKNQRIHTVNQLLKAYTLFEKGTEYIVVDGKVKIVDEQTGRSLDGRRYSDGLHQALEAKEGVNIEDATQTYATVTLQNYFRMYHKLSGMTGTAETEAAEFWDIYKLDVVVIPTNRPIARDDRNDLVYKTVREKFNAVAEEIVELKEKGRPILVGTTSVEISELLSRMLDMRKIPHQVLNAKLHQKEAEVVAEAGKSGTVTIATNMAGRGTDIKLTPESKEAGGLAIIGTERHESRRVDRQLRGRSGRQGDPGSSQFFVCLEDQLMRLFGSERVTKIMDRMGMKEGEVISHSMITKSIERAQRKVEENNFGMRKRLLEYDDVMNSQREIIYKRRKNALSGERLQFDILNTFYDTCENVAANYAGTEQAKEFKFDIVSLFGLDFSISNEELNKANQGELTEKLYEEVLKNYHERNKEYAKVAYNFFRQINPAQRKNIKYVPVAFFDGKQQIEVGVNLEKLIESEGKEAIKAMERVITLALIDQEWKEHLREMDDLKQSVRMAQYEQKDPLVIYKFEGFNLFEQFVAKVNEMTVSFLSKAQLMFAVEKAEDVQEARKKRRRRPKLDEQKANVQPATAVEVFVTNQPQAESESVLPAKSDKAYGRNDVVSVQYRDGRRVEKVKFKKVQQDVEAGECVVLI